MKLTLPGLIDPHVHLRDPGQTEKEDFFTGTLAALAGGFTIVLDMPNNKKPITSSFALDEKINIAKEKIVSDIGFYFGSLGDNLDQFKNAAEKTFGLKIFLNHTTGDYLLRPDRLEEILQAWPISSPVLFHAENETFEMVLNILKKNPRPIHLCHISSKFELEKVIEAKEMDLPVTCGVTPHHLFLTENDLSTLKGFGMMKPPLQKREDVEYLWENLSTIDCIESDHAPHTREEKESITPAFGVPNLETTLPLLLTEVGKGRLTIDDVIRLCHDGPKKIFHVPTDENTKVEIDTDIEYEIKNENLFTKCKWTPFGGWKVKGRVLSTTIRGEKAFENGSVTVQPGSGHILARK